jgi:hypothetical protein
LVEIAQSMNCIVCNTPNARREPGFDDRAGADFARFDCLRCGSFVLTGTAEEVLPHRLDELPLRRSLMSHTLRRMQRPGHTHLRLITSDDLPTFWSRDRLPSPQEQADDLILWVGDNQPSAETRAEITQLVLSAWLGTALSSPGHPGGIAGWHWLHTELKPEKLYTLEDVKGDTIGLRLTMAGWQRHAELKKTNIQSRTAFMAMKFGDALIDRVVAECFRPAVTRAGFGLRLLTDEQPAGLIDDQLRAAILSARFLIADLSHGNQGAYWEAGFAEGLDLPVIYTCRAAAWAKSKTHFDTNHMKTIIWSEDELGKAGKELTATIRATLRAEAKQTDDG